MTRDRGSRSWVKELAALRAEVAELRSSQTRYIEAPVTAVDSTTGTFTIDILGQVDGVTDGLEGISAPDSFMPDVGDTVQLAMYGPQPLYQPGTIAENAITTREIAPLSITPFELSFSLDDVGGTTIFYGSSTPTDPVPAIGDLWVKTLGTVGGVLQHETRRWDGTTWNLLADQSVTQALLDAATAQSTANSAQTAGTNALVNAAAANSAAGAAQTTANSKNKSFTQTTAPSSSVGLTVGDVWNDSDDGMTRYYWNGTAWTTAFVGPTAISATARQLGSVTTYRQSAAPASGMIVGDFWIDSDDGKLYRWDGSTWVLSQDAGIAAAAAAALAAQNTANIKTTTYYQATTPPTTSRVVGDTWVDTSNGNRISTWNGTAWTLTPFSAAALSVTARQLGAVTTYRQSTAPVSGMATGDLFIDSDDNTFWYYNGTSWVQSQDAGIAAASAAAAAAQTTANTKTLTYYQTSTPPTTSRTAGDMWVDTDDGNKIYVWNGAWTATLFAASALSATARQLGAVTTYRQSTAPVSGMATGDLFIDSDDNTFWYYNGTSWVQSQDAGIAAASAAASAAQTTANSKTLTYYQISTPPTTSRTLGDMWVDTDDGNKIYVWNGTAWTATLFAAAALSVTARQLGAVTTYRQSAAPASGMVTGDLWIDSDDNSFWYYNGTTWVASADAGIAAASAAAAAAQGTANIKTTVYYQTTTPPTTSRVVGDLWVDTGNGNRISTWSGSAWVLTQFAAQAISATARQLGAITIFRQATAPASGMILGDYWIDSDDNSDWYYNGTAWISSQDAAINTAINAAATAQATADGKVRIFPQPTAPAGLTSADDGDEWIDTDDGNKLYIWQATGTVTRQNLALNPSFEADTSGTKTSLIGWTNYSSGTVNTVTRSIVTTGGVTSGTKAAKAVSSSQAIAAGTGVGYQQTVNCSPADVFRVAAACQLAVTDTNKVPYILVEWLNASGTLISSVNASGSGTLTTSQSVVATGTAPALTAFARITIFRRSNGSGTALTNADLTIDAVMVEKNRPANAQTTYFDGDTGGEAKWDGDQYLSTSTNWQESTSGSYAWQPRLIRSNAIQPASIVASSVIATGTVSAALLESIVVLASVILAGDPNSSHSTMEPDGFHLYQNVPGEGVQEVGKLGTTGDDFFALANSAGEPIFSVDDTGVAIMNGLVVNGDPIFNGLPFSEVLGSASGSGNMNPSIVGAQSSVGWADAHIVGVTTEIGLVEVAANVSVDRYYKVGFAASYSRWSSGGGVEARFRVRGSTGTPSISSTQLVYKQLSNAPEGFETTGEGSFYFYPTATGQYRFLLTVSNNTVGTIDIGLVNCIPLIDIIDMGPRKAQPASVNRGGGGTPPPVQQTYVDLAPNGQLTYNGSNGIRSDTLDIIQGYDPSGFNGDGHGYWTFPLPSITGSVDRVDLYLYSNHWYYNSGGTAILNIIQSGDGANIAALKLRSDWYVGGYPKGGGMQVTTPSDWWPQFKNTPPSGARAIGISVGPGGGTNELYYGRFTRDQARLRIWYTQ